MKNVCLNKKGFTLVELLAVIVILALLIVITANTVLPMMNKSKQNAMVVYGERVLSNASTSFQADSISAGLTQPQYYSIETLMGQADYFGCVKVAYNSTTKKYEYNILMYDNNNKMKLEGKTTSTTIKKAADKAIDTTYAANLLTTTYTDDYCEKTTGGPTYVDASLDS